MSQRIFPITMPKWGIEMQRGTITGWHVTPGNLVEKGASLLDVETDKIVNAVEAPVSGYLRRVLAESGATEEVGALLAVLADLSISDSEIQAFVRDFKPVDASFEGNDDKLVATMPLHHDTAPAAPLADGESRISPIARRIAERLQVDLKKVTGTGRNGRVSKEDVEAYAAGSVSSGVAPSVIDTGAPRRVKLTAMRAAIGRRLLESTTGIPHYRLAVDVDFAELLSHKLALSESGTRVSVNDLVVRACALTLMQHPALNCHLVGDEILQFPHADICVAVATDTGLLTPVVRHADLKTSATISAEIKALGLRARAGTLTRDEISGGSFTVSNLGTTGIERFDAIINPPQVAILAVGATIDRAIARDGAVIVTPMATLTLSADHRVVDGAVAAKFLMALKAFIATPSDL